MSRLKFFVLLSYTGVPFTEDFQMDACFFFVRFLDRNTDSECSHLGFSNNLSPNPYLSFKKTFEQVILLLKVALKVIIFLSKDIVPRIKIILFLCPL